MSTYVEIRTNGLFENCEEAIYEVPMFGFLLILLVIRNALQHLISHFLETVFAEGVAANC